MFSDQPQSATPEPESAENTLPPTNPPADNRPKHHGSETRQTAQIAGRAPFPTKAKIASIAKAQGLTESKVVVDLVHKALQMDADVQYGAMLRPVIQDQTTKTSKATATAPPISICKRSTPQNRTDSFLSISSDSSLTLLTRLMS